MYIVSKNSPSRMYCAYNHFAGIAQTGITFGWGYKHIESLSVDGGINYEFTNTSVQSGKGSLVPGGHSVDYEIREITQTTDLVLVVSITL